MKMKANGLTLGADRFSTAHFCQLHQNESSLIDSVIRYMQVGLASGENAVIVTRPNRQKKILSWLTAKGTAVSGGKRRVFVYSDSDLLQSVTMEGRPEWQRFQVAASELLEEATWSGTKKVRFYGDAVSALWQSGSHAAAVELEAFWNRFRQEGKYEYSLFCGYLIEALNPLSYSEHLARLCLEHEFIIPAPEELKLRSALDEALRQVLGLPLSALRANINDPADRWLSRLPGVFRLAIWINERHPTLSDRILLLAKEIYQKGVREQA